MAHTLCDFTVRSDEMLTPTITSCQLPHAFCLSCLLEVMKDNGYGQQSGRCPLCRFPISKSEVTLLKLGSGSEGPPTDAADEPDEGADEDSLHSTKLDALLEVLRERADEHPKTVIFTVFTATQGLVASRLRHEGHRFVEIRAGASQVQRATAFNSFTSDPDEGCCSRPHPDVCLEADPPRAKH